MTYRSLTPTPANIPTSPATARSYARITRPILTLSGPRAKTEAEIIAAAQREANAGKAGTAGATQSRSQTTASPRRKFAPPLAIRKARADFALDYSFQRTPKKD